MHILNAKIIFNKEIAKDIYLLSFKAKEIAAEFKPGQFLMLKPDLFLANMLRRPFSICYATEEEIFILYKIRGKVTKYMASLKKGESISIIGPLGNGFKLTDDQIILVGGGVGIAPLISVLSFYNKVTLIAGYSSCRDYVDIKEIVKGRYEYLISTEDGSMGYKGSCVDLFKDYISSASNIKVLSCGPVPMLKELARVCRERNIPCYVSLETYMACGMGLCQGCVIKTRYGYKRVCKEGPVFRAEVICWDQI